MSGIFRPSETQQNSERKFRARALAWLRGHPVFLPFVLMPTLICAAYYGLIAAPQYQSEAHFVVKTAENAPVAPGGLGQFLGFASANTQARTDAMSVNDYLQSQNATDYLRAKLDLVGRYRQPGVDIFSKLWGDNPSPESLLKYYRRHVDVELNSDSGITQLRVRAFRPTDSFIITSELLKLGETRVNFLNRRSLTDSLANSRAQLADAERALEHVQRQMTEFRQMREDIDPEGSGKAQILLVSSLTATLTQAKAALASMDGIISPKSPQYIAAASRVRALQAQLAVQSSRLTRGGGAIATRLGGYEDLQIKQQFAAKRYEAAAANLEKARDQASKQQLYIVRVVDPALPVKALYPRGLRITFTLFLSLLVAYSIGWLLVAGAREHAL